MPNTSRSNGYELLFLDTSIPNYQSVLSSVKDGVETILINPDRDGIAQITATLANRSDVSAIHIVSHGGPGYVSLGSGALSLDSLPRYTPQLQSWSSALTADADILFYGCNIAAGDEGLAFVNALAMATGADVAASDDLTGAARLGGDWDLEVQSGLITAASLVPDYDGLLPSVSFATAINYAVGIFPYSVTSGDFNSDGRLDLASVNFGNGNLSVLLGNGGGGFSGAVNYAIGSGPISVTSGDFNNDSRLDIASANQDGHNVSVLLNNGSGGFSGATNYPVGSVPLSVANGDFNSDGRLDLVSANYNSNNVSVLLGNSSGGFSGATNYPVGSAPFSVTTGDFNGDGRSDIASASNGSNNVSVLLGDGSGGFSGAVNYPVGTSPVSVTSADLNGDGRLDLVSANWISNNLSVLLGNSSGGFSGAVNYGVGSGPRPVTIGDFNSDGRIDIACANESSNNVSVLLGNGSGGFGGAVNYPVGSSPVSATSGDFNSDGRLDFVIANSGSNNLSVLLNTSTVENTPPSVLTGLDLAAADDTGTSNSDNLTTQTSALTISGGGGVANNKLSLFDDKDGDGIIDSGELLTTIAVTG
ncbi:MAG: VCBS repeat-containing protein, partial [Magnetococcales bacterium]|nr:VCBS repeat-containing protein [Magnetococcales bacterium]